MAALALAAVSVAAVPLTASASPADVVTVSNDNARTGWDPSEPNLGSSQITDPKFGQLFSTPVNGQVYAQPLVVGSTLIAATDNDFVYGINATTGAVKWTRSIGPAWPSSAIGCTDLQPTIGVTSTPVYDPSTGTVYLVAKVNDGPDVMHPHWYMHAMDAQTGVERTGWPVVIQGAPENDTASPFNPYTAMQRPGLLLVDGRVYVGFASLCDRGPYRGYVVGVHTTDRAVHMWTDEVGQPGGEAGIWQAGGGLVSDGSGRVFFATGNGISPAAVPGASPPQQLGDAVVHLGVDSLGVMSAQDFFSPSNAPTLAANDTDLGSGGPVALPDSFGTTSHPHLMLQIGKDGRLFLLDRDHLGGRSQGPGGTDAALQIIQPNGGVWGHLAVWGGDGGYVYLVENAGNGGHLLAFQRGTSASGDPTLTRVGSSNETFGTFAGSPAVTSNGTTSGSAVVWAVNADNANGTNGRLCAYQPVPVNGVLTLLRCVGSFTAPKFATPATNNGTVYIGTRLGHIEAFGLPAAPTSPLTVPSTDFGKVSVGGSAQQTVTATATRTVTVTGVTTASPYSANTAGLTFPVTLTQGQTISVPVTFAPATTGSAVGNLNFATSDAQFPQVQGGLTGIGTQTGFSASPNPVDFGQVPAGGSKQITVAITNTSTLDETITGTTAPSMPFTATNLPAAGTIVPAGGTVSVAVTYAPTAASSADQSSFVINANDSTGTPVPSLTVNLTGTAVAGVTQLSISPNPIDFGQVPVGRTASTTVTMSNTGNLPVTINSITSPSAPFGLSSTLTTPQNLAPNSSVQVTATFTPTAQGAAGGDLIVNASDSATPHDVKLVGTGIAVVVPPPGGGWTYNGSAYGSGTDTVLTNAATGLAGSAVYGTAVPSAGLRAHFTASIGGGTGADGLTFSLLDASKSTPTSLGVWGGGLGFSGLSGVAVALVTYQQPGAPSSNFVGVSTSGNADTLTFSSTATNIPNLRSGTHDVDVSVNGSTLTIAIDGMTVLTPTVQLPPNVLLAFTAGTGRLTDVHTVRNVSVTAGGNTVVPPGGGWSFNGSAFAYGTDAFLTRATAGTAGSAVYPQAIPTEGLHAHFTASIGGGTGADGLTFSLLAPAASNAQSLGVSGGGLGFSGLSGVAVALVTYQQSGAPSSNFVGISTSGSADHLTFSTTATNIPNLRTGTHDVDVTVSGGTLSVAIDGTTVINAIPVTLPANVLPAFTAGCGTLTDVHTVSNVTIS